MLNAASGDINCTPQAPFVLNIIRVNYVTKNTEAYALFYYEKCEDQERVVSAFYVIVIFGLGLWSCNQ